MEDGLRVVAVMDRILDYFSGNNSVMSDFVSIVVEGGISQRREGRLLDNIGRVAKLGADESLVDAFDGMARARSGCLVPRASGVGQDLGEWLVAIFERRAWRRSHCCELGLLEREYENGSGNNDETF